MTIEEAVTAARKNVPVVYDSPMLGPQLYARIGCIRKSYPPERVREATPEELGDIRQYRVTPSMPEVRPELLCEEVKSGRPWGERKG